MDRQQLRAAMEKTVTRQIVAVEVPVWGTVYVRSLTVEEVDQQQAENRELAERKDAAGKPIRDTKRFARGAARVLCDEAGEPLYDVMKPEDVELLAKQPWKLLSKVVNVAAELEEGSETGKD